MNRKFFFVYIAYLLCWMQTLFFIFAANASNLMTTISIRRSYRKQFILSNCLRYPYCEYPDTEKKLKKTRWLCCSHRTCSAVHFPARTVRHLCLENRLLMRLDLQNSKIWEQNFLMETVCSVQRQQLLKITNERKQHKMHNIEGCACRHGEDCSFRTYGYGCARTHAHTHTTKRHNRKIKTPVNSPIHPPLPSLTHPHTNDEKAFLSLKWVDQWTSSLTVRIRESLYPPTFAPLKRRKVLLVSRNLCMLLKYMTEKKTFSSLKKMCVCGISWESGGVLCIQL